MKVLSKMADARKISKKHISLTYLATLVLITTAFTLAEAQVFGPLKVSNSGNTAVNSEIAVFENGNCVVTWENGADICWRRLSDNGSFIDNISQANATDGSLIDPDVATSENDWFAIVWQEFETERCSDACPGDVWLREFDPEGIPPTVETDINNGYVEGAPFITYGDIWQDIPDMPWWGVTWQPDEQAPQSENVHFNSYSNWMNNWIRLDPAAVPYGPIGISAVGSGDDLRYTIVYKKPAHNEFRARKVDRWCTLDPVVYTFALPTSAAICGAKASMNAAGRIGIVWIEHEGMSSTISLQEYVLNGNQIQVYGAKKQVCSTAQWVDNVAITPCGTGFAVAWNQAETWNNSATNIYVRKITGSILGSLKWVDRDANTRDTDPSLQVLGNMCYVSWTKTVIGQWFGEVYASKINLGISGPPLPRVTQQET